MPAALLPPPTQATTTSGSRPSRSRNCCARLAADDRLEVADDHRERVRAHHGADDVVRVLDTLLIQSRMASLMASLSVFWPLSTGDHVRAEQLHAEDVELLAADVLGAHVDDALQAEDGRGRGRGHAVLAGAGLGDDPLLAHAQGQQGLAERVVDLVRAGVVEVLALEVDPRPAELLAQPPGEVQRARPADVVLEVAVQLGPERRVLPGPLVFLFKLVNRPHERLGDILPAVRAETAVGVGDVGQV